MNFPTKPNSSDKPCRNDCPNGDCANCGGVFGASHCTKCAVGQGDDCACIQPMTFDRAALRIVLGGLALFWSLALVAAITRGCAA